MARVMFVEGVSKRMSYEEVVASSGAGLQNAFQENKAYTPLTLFCRCILASGSDIQLWHTCFWML